MVSFKKGTTWHTLLGDARALIKKPHQVTPASLTALAPLLESWLRGGLLNCMVLPARLQLGLKGTEDDELPKTMTWPCYLTLIADHIMINFSFLRTLVIEDTSTSLTMRKYQKTNAFRRRCSSAESVVISQLKKLVVLEGATSSATSERSVPSIADNDVVGVQRFK